MPPKRKAAESSTTAHKKAKLEESGAAEVAEILALAEESEKFDVADEESEVRRQLLLLARYARSLEEELASTKPKPEDKTAEEVEKLAAAVRSGIKKQLTVGFCTC